MTVESMEFAQVLAENDANVKRFLHANHYSQFTAINCKQQTIRRRKSSQTRLTNLMAWDETTLPTPLDMRYYVNAVGTTNSRRSTMATCMNVSGTLSEVVKTISTDVTPTYRRVEADLMGDDLLVDAQVLETVKPRTKENPHEYIGIKHVKYRSVIDDHQGEDFLLLETTGKDVDRDGFQYVYKMLYSIELPGEGDLLERKNETELVYHRGILHTFMVLFTETKDPDTLRMQVWLDVNLTKNRDRFYGGFSSLHDAFSLAVRYRFLVEKAYCSNGAAHATAVGSQIQSVFAFLPVTNVGERKCQTCEKKVGIFSWKRRHVCAVCGIIVCSSCLTSTDFNNWKLCGLCFDRNERVVSRHRITRIASLSVSKLNYLAKMKMGMHRQRPSLYATSRVDGQSSLRHVINRNQKSGSIGISFLQKTSGKYAYDIIAEGIGQENDGVRASLFDGRPSLYLSSDDEDNDNDVVKENESQKSVMDAVKTRFNSLSKSTRLKLLDEEIHNRLSGATTWRSSASDLTEITSIPESGPLSATTTSGTFTSAGSSITSGKSTSARLAVRARNNTHQ